jgi:hypothetical protein
MSAGADSGQSFTRSVFDRSYWLSRCEGFRVDSPRGRVGIVSELVFGSRLDQPDALVVRVGLLARRTILISTSEVAEIVPSEKRLRLEDQPALLG